MSVGTEVLNSDADEGGERTLPDAGSDFGGSLSRAGILFVVRSRPVAVFKIDPEVLDGLAGKFGGDALVDRPGKSGGRVGL